MDDSHHENYKINLKKNKKETNIDTSTKMQARYKYQNIFFFCRMEDLKQARSFKNLAFAKRIV